MKSEYHTKETRITTALLLAAGTGSRLMPLTQEAPKCLTMINEISMLERLVESLKKQGFKRLVVVTGHLKIAIEEFLGSKYGDMEIEYVHSPKYKTTNNIYSLWMARALINEPFVMFESDLVFEVSLLDEMIYPDRIAVASIADWMNGTTVTVKSNQMVKKFKNTTKPSAKRTKYKTVNIYSFSVDSWENILRRLETHISEGRVNGYYETVFAELVKEGALSLKAISFDSQPWYEVDTILDLEEAVKLFPAKYTNTTKNIELAYEVSQ
ncbi:MAG: phosphocholine cytidylyltransferase family protein [Cyclobacteriaceae bacterium]